MAKGDIAQYIDRVLKLVQTGAADMEKQLDEHFKGEPFGARRPTPEETMGFIQLVLKQDPPDWYVFPDGHKEFNSGWFIAVRDADFLEGGKAAYRSVERAEARFRGGV